MQQTFPGVMTSLKSECTRIVQKFNELILEGKITDVKDGWK